MPSDFGVLPVWILLVAIAIEALAVLMLLAAFSAASRADDLAGER